MKVSVPGPPMQISVPSPAMMRSSPPPPRMQSSPPSPSIASAPELPRIKSLPSVPVNVPEPVMRFVKNNPLHVDGFRSLMLTFTVWCETFVAGMVLAAAKAVAELMMMSATKLKVKSRSAKGMFII